MKSDFWPEQTDKLRGVLGIEHPIIQAPMAGGPATPELVAAVSDAGGLGSLGAGYLSPEEIVSNMRRVRSLTDKPYAVNLFVPEKAAGIVLSEKVVNRLSEVAGEIGVEVPDAPLVTETKFEDQLQAVLDNDVPVFSFTFGIPGERYMEDLKRRGITVIGTATCVREAVLLEEAGCDAVVAQGIEAGGHRGTFDAPGAVPMIGGLSLVPQIADKVRVPVISSGGIMDGRGIAAALALGASAVQMGTAFLSCREASVPEPWLEALGRSLDTSTVLTRVFTGKYARGIRNRFIDEFSGLEDEIPPYPVQHALTRPLRAAAKEKGEAEYMSLWAGQGSPMSRRCAAGELMESLVSETREALGRLGSGL